MIKLRHVAHVEQSGPQRDVETRHNGHSTKHKRLGCVLFYTGNSFLGVLNFHGYFFPVPGFSEMVFRDTASNFSLSVWSLKLCETGPKVEFYQSTSSRSCIENVEMCCCVLFCVCLESPLQRCCQQQVLCFPLVCVLTAASAFY